MASAQAGKQLMEYLDLHREALFALLEKQVAAESPSSEPASQQRILGLLEKEFNDLDLSVQRIAGVNTGGHLLAEFGNSGLSGKQLMIGHCDTVWPVGTLNRMPWKVEGGIIKGPGVFDMKGGLVQMVFALRAIRELGFVPPLQPVIFINSDEEIGSFESEPYIMRLAQEVSRVFVIEPALGESGKLKTARKGVGGFTIDIKGKAAHAGLDPEKGISAIHELSYVIQELYDIADAYDGVTVNVGIIEGGTRTNVVAPWSKAEVDVRIPTVKDAKPVENDIMSLQPRLSGIELSVQGGINRLPMERTEANQSLWRKAQKVGEALGLKLEEGSSGGGSDGNTTSQYVATLDGLGPVGDGAHADHEYIVADKLLERCALLALLLLEP
jgi:glutamate carboxypeptidase